MKYCDGEKCKDSVPAWPVNLTSHTRDFLRQTNGVLLEAVPNRRPIDEAIEMFERWLILKDPTPLYAVFGAVAANLCTDIVSAICINMCMAEPLPKHNGANC